MIQPGALATLPREIAESLPTPCLVVDVKACERNLKRAATHFQDVHAKLRPHFKAHKCTELMRRQLDAGSCVGVTCATGSEAEVLAGHGFDDILVANQIVDRAGLGALSRAAAAARVTVAVDDLAHVRLLAAEAERHGVVFGVLIEVDVGMGRCGLAPGSDTLPLLAEAIVAHERLSLRGLQGYEGHAVLLQARAQRREQVVQAGQILAQERARLLELGHPCPIISGGGTGTFDLVTELGVLDEVQAGSYALMDARYGELDLPFEHALFLLSTLISHPRPGAATVNAGLKALTVEHGMPKAVDPSLEMLSLADEHGLMAVAAGSSPVIGDQVILIPAHIDPTINLHDVLFAWDSSNETIDEWAVDGRRTEANESQPRLAFRSDG